MQDVPILCGDVGNQASVDAVVKGSRVVLSTTGPYALMGTPVVDACVRMRTHYCDLTGEVSRYEPLYCIGAGSASTLRALPSVMVCLGTNGVSSIRMAMFLKLDKEGSSSCMNVCARCMMLPGAPCRCSWKGSGHVMA